MHSSVNSTVKASLWVAVAVFAIRAEAQLPGKVPGLDARAFSCAVIRDCPYYWDFYRATPSFREAFAVAMRQVNKTMPSWIPNGTASSVMPITVGTSVGAIGSICQPHNCPHQVVTIFYRDSQKFVGMYIDDQDKLFWLGSPTDTEKTVMRDFADQKLTIGQVIPGQASGGPAETRRSSVQTVSPATLMALPKDYEGRRVQFTVRASGGLQPDAPGRSRVYIDDYNHLTPILQGAVLRQWLDSGLAPSRVYAVTFVGRVRLKPYGSFVDFEVDEFWRE